MESGMNTGNHLKRILQRGGYLLVMAGLAAGTLSLMGCGGDNGTNPVTYPKPVITDAPQAIDVQSYEATIGWTTDVEATSAVLYGTQSGVYTQKDSLNANKSTIHRVRLASLRSNTTYYYVAQSKSAGGFIRSDQGSFQTVMSTADMVPAAWGFYQQNKLTDAIAMFGRLKAAQPQSYEAFTGLGWCYAHPQLDSLEKSLISFNGALALNSAHTDALAGRGFVRLALNLYGQAAVDFEKVLSLAPSYRFAYDAKVSANAIRLGLAEAYFYLQAFSNVQNQIDVLAAGNGLNPGQSATWSVDGKTYASYAEALMAWIEKLKAQG
jgi:tetratricopeptide (TPR) repeat protein